jgi:hypothetical protein
MEPLPGFAGRSPVRLCKGETRITPRAKPPYSPRSRLAHETGLLDREETIRNGATVLAHLDCVC